MRVPIPPDMREQLAADPFMSRCIIYKDCEGRIEWNHAFSYAGRRRNVIWGILPMCSKHHREEARYRALQTELMRDRIHHFNAYEEVRENYPKSLLV